MKKELYTTEAEKNNKAILISLLTPDSSRQEAETSLDELERLADTAGMEVVGRISQSKMSPDPATYIGKGKIEEAKVIIQANKVDFVIIDDEVSPSQIKNIEDIIGGETEVIDRTMLILEIFSQHAHTSEGKLQVEIAKMRYTFPRLLGRGKDMSRLGGAASGQGGLATRGSGETKLEMDRRTLKGRIAAKEEELRELEKSRSVMRHQREKAEMKNIAVAGYTNSGKSTLLNYLTNAGILAEDKLFATLDPTTRKLNLPNGEVVLLTDTVGLIKKLPHHLVNAFKSTLDEIKYADMILHVADLSDPEYEDKIMVTKELFNDMGVKNVPVILVYNKVDRLEDDQKSRLDIKDGGVFISALTGENIDVLLQKIQDTLDASRFTLHFLFPMANQAQINTLYKNANIIEREYLDSSVLIKASVDEKTRNMLIKYVIDEKKAKEYKSAVSESL